MNFLLGKFQKVREKTVFSRRFLSEKRRFLSHFVPFGTDGTGLCVETQPVALCVENRIVAAVSDFVRKIAAHDPLVTAFFRHFIAEIMRCYAQNPSYTPRGFVAAGGVRQSYGL